MLVHRVRAREQRLEVSPCRSRVRARARPPTTASSGRRPSPTSRSARRAPMPNASIAASLVETAAKCRGTAASPSRPASQARTRRAFASVSWVVKVFEQTITSVRAGSSAGARSANCVPSTFETKWVRSSPASYGASAAVAMAGPEVAAADADVDDVGEARAARAGPPPLVHLADERRALRANREHLGVLRPRGRRAPCPPGVRSSVCSAARRSVALTSAPAEQRVDPCARQAARLRPGRRSASSAAASRRWRLKSNRRPAGLAREVREALRVRGKQRAHRRAGEAARVARERVSQGS